MWTKLSSLGQGPTFKTVTIIDLSIPIFRNFRIFQYFISVQTVFFGALAMSTLRMKYLWTPYICILAGFGIADYKAWKTILVQLNTQGIVVCIQYD